MPGAPSADDDVHQRRALEKRLPFLLRDASGHRHHWVASRFLARYAQLAESGVELLLGALPDAAGVDDDDIRVAVVLRAVVASGLEQARPICSESW